MLNYRFSSCIRLMFLFSVWPLIVIDSAAQAQPDSRPVSNSSRPAAGISAIPGATRMLVILDHIARESVHNNRFVGDDEIRRYTAALSALPQSEILRRADLAKPLSHALMRLGRLDEARTLLESALSSLADAPESGRDQLLVELQFALAVAWFRQGEVDNCVECCNGESCLFPFTPAALHQNPKGSTEAIRYLLPVLEASDAKSPGHRQARWLLNLAHMTLGTYPEGVAEALRVPIESIAGSGKHPPFENIAASLGLDVLDLAGGVLVDHFDEDLYLDIIMTSMDPAGSMRFFRGLAAGGFRDETTAAGLDGLRGGGLHTIHGDYDNDGDLDFLVLRGAWLGDNGRHPMSLFENDGSGRFVDRTYEAGLADIFYPTQTAAFADYDNDGDLDLFVGNEARPGEPFPSQLFQNQGNGTFKDVADQAGVTNLRFAKGCAFGDINGDRYPDLYVSNMNDRNRLYLNNRNGTFTDVALESGVVEPLASFPCWFWDFDHDGHLDLFVASYEQDSGSYISSRLEVQNDVALPRLYKGDGRGGFRDVAAQTGLKWPVMAMGASFGDFDNDGWQDVYLATGYPAYEGLVPNILLWNRRGARFLDITASSRTGSLQKGHAVAFADINRDGNLDILVRLGGAYRADGFRTAVYAAPKNNNNYLEVRLAGTQSNRRGVGARVSIEIDENGGVRRQVRFIGMGSSFGGNPLVAHFGIGKVTEVRRLEVFWPTTNQTQILSGVPCNQMVTVVEPKLVGPKDN